MQVRILQSPSDILDALEKMIMAPAVCLLTGAFGKSPSEPSCSVVSSQFTLESNTEVALAQVITHKGLLLFCT